MKKSKFFVQITGTRNELPAEQFNTRKQAEKTWDKYSEKVAGVGEKVEAWEQTPDGKFKDLFTGEELS